MKRILFVAALSLSLAACSGSDENVSTIQSSACQAATDEGLVGALFHEDVASDRFLMKLSPDTRGSEVKVRRFLGSLPNDAITEKVGADFYRLKFSRAVTGTQVARQIESSGYEYIEPDFKVQTTLVSNDDFLGSQWAHEKVKSAEAWDVTRGSENVIVAVLDSGVDYTHPDLAGNMWANTDEELNGVDDDGNGYVDDIRGWNFANDNNNPMADDSPGYHGTHVAGTVGAVGNNGVGISGHAQVVKLMALKFLGSGGSGYTSDAIKGIDYAIKNGAQIISNSWGSGNYSQSLNDAVKRARNAGILFVAAAGNSGRNNDTSNFYPANYPHDNVIAVAATTSSDILSSFSNYGASKVHIAAPGSSIYSTKNGNTYTTKSGTSMATPLVSGVLAMMVGLRPDLSYLQHKEALLESVDQVGSLTGKVIANGRINAFNAVSLIAELPTDTAPVPRPAPNCP